MLDEEDERLGQLPIKGRQLEPCRVSTSMPKAARKRRAWEQPLPLWTLELRQRWLL